MLVLFIFNNKDLSEQEMRPHSSAGREICGATISTVIFIMFKHCTLLVQLNLKSVLWFT